MRQQLLENQIFEGKSWNGFTDKNHLINAFDFDTVEIAKKVIQLQEVNLGMDFASMVMSHGIHYIEPGKEEINWDLDNEYDTHYELLDVWEDRAGTSAIGTTAGLLPGANRTRFYMDFKGKVFSHTETIVGMKPDLFNLLVAEEPFEVGGDIWRFPVELASSRSAESYVPLEEVYVGSRWSCDAGLVTDTLSDDGFDISFNSKTKLRSRLSRFRMKHVIPGNMFDIKPMGFYVGKGSSKQMLWINNVEYEFIKKAKYTTANLIMNGKSNVWEDGTVGNYYKNGYKIEAGSGFKEQWANSNKHLYNLEPDLDFLTQITLDAVVGKVPMGKRKVIIKAGEYGLMELSKMVERKYGSAAFLAGKPWTGDNTGRAYDWTGNEVGVRMGQVMNVAMINNIHFYFVLDPSKDDPKRNKLQHPKGGLASSYEYDIMGWGNTDEKANMQIVRTKGQTPIYGAAEGMRGFAQGGNSFMSPKAIASAVDGTTIHYFDPGVGAIVWDPTKVIQYHPSILH